MKALPLRGKQAVYQGNEMGGVSNRTDVRTKSLGKLILQRLQNVALEPSSNRAQPSNAVCEGET
jgi:hypothetical protein